MMSRSKESINFSGTQSTLNFSTSRVVLNVGHVLSIFTNETLSSSGNYAEDVLLRARAPSGTLSAQAQETISFRVPLI